MRPSKILVIEDNPTTLELARDLLELAGFVVLNADSGDLGIALAKAARPHLILLDLDLSGTAGLEVAGRLHADPETAGITIVGLSGSATRSEQERALASGCRGFLSKPINTRLFWAQIRELLPPPEEG